MTADRILDRATFRAWLVEHANDEVGLTYDCHDCPIARFVKVRTNTQIATADTDEVQYGDATECAYVLTPDWAAAFINQIDDGEAFSSITGHRALAILDGIEEE